MQKWYRLPVRGQSSSKNIKVILRINNIRNIGVGPNSDTLDPGVTVFDDGDVDDLDGNSGDDWFFAGVGDSEDSVAGEVVESL